MNQQTDRPAVADEEPRVLALEPCIERRCKLILWRQLTVGWNFPS